MGHYIEIYHPVTMDESKNIYSDCIEYQYEDEPGYEELKSFLGVEWEFDSEEGKCIIICSNFSLPSMVRPSDVNWNSEGFYYGDPGLFIPADSLKDFIKWHQFQGFEDDAYKMIDIVNSRVDEVGRKCILTAR